MPSSPYRPIWSKRSVSRFLSVAAAIVATLAYQFSLLVSREALALFADANAARYAGTVIVAVACVALYIKLRRANILAMNPVGPDFSFSASTMSKPGAGRMDLLFEGFERVCRSRSLIAIAALVLGLSLRALGSQITAGASNTVGATWMAVIAAVAAAPIAEEVFFRGILFDSLKASVGALPAVAITSILFGASHAGELNVVLFAALSGLVLGTLRMASNAVWPCVIAHAVSNMLQIIGVANV